VIEARRRAGELLACRASATGEYLYPAWQFGQDREVLPQVELVLAHARERHMGGDELVRLLGRRVGLTSRRRLLELLLAGETAPVIAAIDEAAAGP
jgi:hypothetical protein